MLRCNRIQLDAMRDRANQPSFLFVPNVYGLDEDVSFLRRRWHSQQSSGRTLT